LLAYRWSANQLIGPTELAIDMHPENERRTARYVEDIPAPSVIALSSIAAAEAVSHFMLAVTGLHHDPDNIASVLPLPRFRERALQIHRQDPACGCCSPTGSLGRGVLDAIQVSPGHQSDRNPSRSGESS
jgi:hypothetical protein